LIIYEHALRAPVGDTEVRLDRCSGQPGAGPSAFEELEVVGAWLAGDEVGFGGAVGVVVEEADVGVVGGEAGADLGAGAGEGVVGAVAAEQLQGVVGVAAGDDFVGGLAGWRVGGLAGWPVASVAPSKLISPSGSRVPVVKPSRLGSPARELASVRLW
jgi:hypothetical protein